MVTKTNLVSHSGLLLATAVLVLSHLLVTGVDARPESGLSTYRACFLFPNFISDLGWTFQHNQERLKALKALNANNASIRWEFEYVENYVAERNKTASLLNLLSRTFSDGRTFDVIFSTSKLHFSPINRTWFALQFPRVLFVEQNLGLHLTASLPENFVNVGIDIWGLWFAAGATAGRHFKNSSDKICMFYPFPRQNMGVNAFYQGLQYANSQAQFHTSMLFSFGDAEKELGVTREFVKNGCQLIVRWADHKESDVYVASLANDTMSIGYASDISAYVGDSAFTSAYITPANLFTSVMLAAHAGTEPPRGLQRMEDGAITLADVSPRGGREAIAAHEAATAWVIANRSQLYCGSYKYINGTAFIPVASDGCLSVRENALVIFALLDGIGILAPYRAPSDCVAGTYVTYDSKLRQTCVPCPADTYTDTAGSEVCLPCPLDLVSSPNSTNCHPKKEGFPVWATALITILCVLLVGAFALTAILLVLRRSEGPIARAPKGPDITLIVIGVDCKRNKRWRHHLLRISDTIASIVTTAAADNLVFLVSSVGEVHLAATDSPEKAYAFIAAVQDSASRAKWPVTISIRGAIHHGRPQVVERTVFQTKRLRYIGPDVEIVRMIYKASASMVCGGVWVSQSTLKAAPPAEGTTVGTEQVPIVLSDRKAAAVQLLQVPHGQLPLLVTLGDAVVAYRPPSDASLSASSTDQTKDSTQETRSDGTEDADDEDEYAITTFSIITPEEFTAAHEFASDVLRLYLGLLPFANCVASLTTVCERLHVAAPRIPDNIPEKEKSLRILRNPIHNVTTQLLRQLEEMELVTVMERWSAAAAARGAAMLRRAANSTSRDAESSVSSNPFSPSGAKSKTSPVGS